jgi:hypothetical protein
MDLDGAFPFQNPYRVRKTVFGRNTQTHMDVVRHRMTFEEFHSQLLTSLLTYGTDLLAHLPIEDVLPVLRNEDDMERAVPFHM